ncbi:tripartite tricarboxylate transporter TctB family protein [uncultured Roseobacter sp.]|uniref:tripartite tricarboxylate transporter TctB family protein n=1 Tax=uncultured Roseobacter sp. TaxID=114847 RepID=UPI002629017C|nr:tripartite tricarboxylate transporter TctB family protein [uncultured Roseobacter sp.]
MTGSFHRSVIVGAVLTVLGLAAGYYASLIPQGAEGGIGGARIFPYIASGAILVCGILELLSGLRRQDTSPLRLTDIPGEIASLLAIAIGYVWLVSKLGYLIATGLIAPLAMLLFGIRNPPGLMAAAILCPAIYHLIFFELLGVFPPFGEWFDLLDILQGS